MQKVKSKINQETIIAPASKNATIADLTKLTAFCVDHLCGCKSTSR